MDDRRLAKARAQNPAYRPAHPLHNPLTWSEADERAEGSDHAAGNHVRSADGSGWDDVLVEEMTPADYESMEHAGRVLYERGWRKEFSVDEMTGAWRQLIVLVEAGYEQLVYEYTNDLSCRDWLAVAWPMLTEHVRSVRQAELDALDAQFVAATTEDKEGKLAQFYRVDAKDGWWWRRIPTRRRGEFARDLDA